MPLDKLDHDASGLACFLTSHCADDLSDAEADQFGDERHGFLSAEKKCFHYRMIVAAQGLVCKKPLEPGEVRPSERRLIQADLPGQVEHLSLRWRLNGTTI